MFQIYNIACTFLQILCLCYCGKEPLSDSDLPITLNFVVLCFYIFFKKLIYLSRGMVEIQLVFILL